MMTALVIGLGVGIAVLLLTAPLIKRVSNRLQNDKRSVNSLFTVPLIFAAALRNNFV